VCACVRTGFEGTADLPLRSRRQTRSPGLTFELLPGLSYAVEYTRASI
jgi:hypothetical protein